MEQGDNHNQCTYYVFDKGYFYNRSISFGHGENNNCLTNSRITEKKIKPHVCCWGRYRFEGDTIYLIMNTFYNINIRKGFVGSEYAKYTSEYRGVLTQGGIKSIKRSRINPVIDSSAYLKRHLSFESIPFDLELTSLKYDLDTLLIKKLIKRD